MQKDGARVRLAANECNLEVCNDVCYQKGGFAGGVCTPDGSCECVDPDKDGESLCLCFFLLSLPNNTLGRGFPVPYRSLLSLHTPDPFRSMI